MEPVKFTLTKEGEFDGQTVMTLDRDYFTVASDRRQFEFPVGDIYFCRFEAGEAPLTAIARAG